MLPTGPDNTVRYTGCIAEPAPTWPEQAWKKAQNPEKDKWCFYRDTAS